MLNTSVMDINSTSVPFNFNVCLNRLYVGMIVAYVEVSLCFILGTPAHFRLLWLSLRADWKIKPSQVFPLNLTVMELFFCMQCAVQILNVLIFNSDTLWREIQIVYSLCWVGRPLMQICICIEQYLAVLHPIMFLKYKGIQCRVVFAAVVWMMAAGFTVCNILLDTFPDQISESIFVISMIVISFCCVSVLCTLKHPGPGDTQTTVQRHRDVGNQQKRNAFNTIFSGLLIILFTYLPQLSHSLFNMIQADKELINCNIVPIINSFNFLGVMIRPLLKMYKNGDMKCFKTSKGN